MKKIITLVLVFSMFLLLVACGGKGNGGGTTPVQSTTEPKPQLSYTSEDYAKLFKTPTSEYRWHAILHSFAGIAASEGIGSLASDHIMKWKQNGQGGIVTNIELSKEYLDAPNAFSDLNNATKVLLKQNMSFWLYDELGYPSGSAGGRTTLDHPEYVAKGLVCITRTGSGKKAVTVNKDNDLLKLYHAYAVDSSGNIHSATVTDNKVSFAGASGDWTLYIFAEKKLYEGTHAQTNGSGGHNWIQRDYLNIMDKNAVAAFINNTYKAYADKFDYFDQAVGVFTDEPSLMEAYIHTGSTVHKYAQLAWVDGFDAKFEEMHGYSILENLHHVFGGDSDYAKIVRVNYRQTVAEIVSENYFGLIAEFCRENGTNLSGHALLEETLTNHVYYYGDLMACLREMDLPGVDALAGNPDTYMDASWPIFMAIKYATSATTIAGKERISMVELCAPDLEADGIITDEEVEMVWTTLNLMYFQGINQINSYFSLEQTGSQAKKFTDYFGRLSYISRNAVWDGDVALYYPINTNQAYSVPSKTSSLSTTSSTTCISEIAKEMFKSQLDFTVVDNEFILEAEVANGRLYTDNVSFSAICMPGCEVVPYEVMQKLKEFEQGGGTVKWVNSVPVLPDDHDDIEAFSALVKGIESTDARQAVKDIKKATEDKFVIERETSSLYVGKYVLDDAPMYWLLNNYDMKKNLTVTYEGATGFDIYDPYTGTITSVEGDSCQVELDKYCAKIVVVKY